MARRTLTLRIRRSILTLATLVVGVAVGMAIQRLRTPPAPVPLAPAADAYQFWDALVDVRTQILANYVEKVDEQKLLNGALNGMLAQLDPYSNYFTRDELTAFERGTTGKFSGVGAEMALDSATGFFMVISPVEDSPALKAGMLAGDRITKIDGEPVDGQNFKELVTKIGGLPGSQIKMTVIHQGGKTPVDLTITREVVQIHSVKGSKHTADGKGGWDFLIDPQRRIAYVRITNFAETTTDDLDKALLPLIASDKGLRGVILDLRFDPGGLLNAGVGVADRFLDEGVIVTTRGRDGKITSEADAKKEGTYPRIPLVVLINKYSASASEVVAGALRDHNRAVLIGERSFGKGSVQNLITLNEGEAALKLTTQYYYLPSGVNIMKKKDSKTWGVDPDSAFLMPYTDEENNQLLQGWRDAEIIRPAAETQPATAPAATGATQPATRPEPFIDRQLQRGLDVLIAYQAFQGDKPFVETTRPSATASVPEGQPATAPATPSTTPATQPEPQTKPATQPDGASIPAAPSELVPK